MTQAAVSQRIQALEQELAVQLFQRHGGRVLLTEAGRRLHAHAQRILTANQEARADVTGRQEPLAGELSLAASSVPGQHFLPQLLSIFQQRHPHIQVRATVADSQLALAQVEQGLAHLGLVGRKGDSPHLSYRTLACDRLALVVPASHAWARRKRVSLHDLTGEPLLLREAGSGSRSCLEQALARAGKSLRDLRVVLELGSNESIKESVLRGMGLAVLSTQTTQKEAEAGLFRLLQITGLSLERELFVVWDRRRALPISAQLFLELLPPCSGKVTSP
jgi:DNA-binding transcriptional LysR family regulator